MTAPTTGPATVLVRGAGLAALAAAARLAKAGHHVVLDTDGMPEGGHWSVQRHLGVAVDELPQVFMLPAAWRDLFKKSGRALDAELSAHRMALVPAPDQLHRFADGRELRLPAERGAQFDAVASAFGTPAARAWTELVDGLDEVWQCLRGVGLEQPARPGCFDRATRAGLWADRSVDDLAARAGDPHLASIVRSQACLAGAVPAGRVPALVAVRLAVHRRFGTWQLVADEDGAQTPLRASRLVELLGERLDLRGVERHGAPAALLGSGLPDLSTIRAADVAADVTVDCRVSSPMGFGGRLLARPAFAPTISHQVVADDPLSAEGVLEVQDHSAGAPLVAWHRRLPDGRTVVTTHDHRRPRPDLAWGLAPTSWRAWQHRPLLRPAGGRPLWHASAGSHAGNAPWGELLSAALAAYEVHEFLTGDDIRPTNKEQPRLPRQARPAVRGRA